MTYMDHICMFIMSYTQPESFGHSTSANARGTRYHTVLQTDLIVSALLILQDKL